MPGRKCKYDSDPEKYNQLAGQYARDGLIEKEISKKFGVSLQTLQNWKNRFPEFRKFLMKGKEVVDSQVEQSLYKRTQGYDYKETSHAEKK